MSSPRKILLWVCAMLLLGAVGTVLYRLYHLPPLTLRGAITAQSSDTRKQLPIADVEITVGGDVTAAPVKSDSTGFFSIPLQRVIRRGHPITLKFRHPDYQPLDLHEFVGDKLFLVRLEPIVRPSRAADGPQTPVGNIRVRYSIKQWTTANIGSAVKAFQVENVGNVPCRGQNPCSPDGRWKAAIGAASLDAGAGNEFRNARVSCIAGPCPFTKIEEDGFSQGGRVITASARNWSDTATFLMEAEVIHSMVSDVVHESYPVIFGPALNFTLPASAEGICIEADFNGPTIIFPLGPELFLSWANCNARVNRDQTKVYRCELKSGYRFQ